MRSCQELLDYLKENRRDEYDFLIEKIFETDDHGGRKYFVGVRNSRLALYYRAMRVFEVSEKNGQTVYSTNSYYANVDVKNDYVDLSFSEMNCKFEAILGRIEDHVYGRHDPKVRREKICQQWIINSTNQADSEWYYLDLEYIDDENPYGRPDMIAIKRNADLNGKHEIALVELKIRRGNYSGLDWKAYKKSEEDYKKLGKNLYDADEVLKELKYGSGIVSHIADFLRYLHDPKAFRSHMREEIIEMINIHKSLGLICSENPLFHVCKIDEIAERPQIGIVSYSYVPTINGDRDKRLDISAMKRSFYNYLYDSDFSLKKLLNHAQIAGFLREEERFASFKQNDDAKFDIVETVGDEKYTFHIIFVDPDVKNEAYECLW